MTMRNRWTDLSGTPPSPWTVALCRLLAGLSETAIGTGLLLGQTATVIERHALSLPRAGDCHAVTRGSLVIERGSTSRMVEGQYP